MECMHTFVLSSIPKIANALKVRRLDPLKMVRIHHQSQQLRQQWLEISNEIIRAP